MNLILPEAMTIHTYILSFLEYVEIIEDKTNEFFLLYQHLFFQIYIQNSCFIELT